MIERMALLGGDRRQTYLAQKLTASGFAVTSYGVPELEDSPGGLAGALEDVQAMVLPMPALTKKGWIRGQTPIPLVPALERLEPGTPVFGGALDAAAETLAEYHMPVYDYTKSLALAAGNAVPTAEGAIQIAMEALPITLAASRCLVIGFGRIGKVLADRLRGLRAEVTVTARKPEDRAMAAAMGFAADRTGLYLRGLRQYDCVFNTVPAPILDAMNWKALSSACLVIDLATGGGLASDVDTGWGPVYRLLPGLPGQVAPATAAEVIRRYLLDTLPTLG